MLSISLSTVFGVYAIYAMNEIIQTSNESSHTLEEELLLADKLIAKLHKGEVTDEDMIRIIENHKDVRKGDHDLNGTLEKIFFKGVIVFGFILALQFLVLSWYLKKENENKVSP